MGLLDELIDSLDNQELEKVRSIPLKGIEQQVMQELLQTRLPEQLPAKPLAPDMSLDHLYKVQSVLLRKCFKALVPEGESQLIWFLNKKSLYKLMFREIQRLDKELMKQSTTQERQQVLYRECFESSVDVMSAHFDESLARQYGDKYLMCVCGNLEGEKVWVEVRLAYARMVKAAMRVCTPEEKQQIEQGWLSLLQAATIQQHHEAQMRSLKGLVYYYTYFNDNKQQRFAYLSRWEAICHQVPDEKRYISLKNWCANDMAEYHFSCNHFAESFRRYQLQLKMADSNGHAWGPYTASRYAQVAILCGEDVVAFELLQRFFAPALKSFQKALTPMSLVLHAQYYLHTGNMAEAKKCIARLHETNTKAHYEIYEVSYRALQTIWHWLGGEKSTAAQLAQAHIKYLRKRKISLDYDPLTMVFLVVLAMYKEQQDGKKLNKRNRQRQTDLSFGPHYLLGKLLFGAPVPEQSALAV